MSLSQDGKVIVPLSPAAIGGQQGSSVEYLFDIAPGLYSRSPDDVQATVGKAISKPRVLVHVGNGLNTGPKTGTTLLKWIENESKRETTSQKADAGASPSTGRDEATNRPSVRSTFSNLNRKLKR